MRVLKRIIAILLVTCLCLQLVGCASPVKTAEYAKKKVVSWFSSLDTERFREGCEYALEYMGIQTSALMTSEYMQNIETAITDLKGNLNSAAGSARLTAQEAGFAAEKWAAGTFNINSAANNSNYTAEVVGSNGFGSVDVSTNYGENASLKYYQTANESANAQAKSVIKAYGEYKSRSSNPKTFEEYLNSNNIDSKTKEAIYKSVYEGQTRIIPADQLTEATQYLQGKISKLSMVEGEATSLQIKTYKEVIEKLRDRLQAPDGTQSIPLTNEEAQAIAELSQKGQFKPEDFGVTLSQVVNYKVILKQAMGTGLGVGFLKTAFEVGPDLFSTIIEAAKYGKIDENHLKKIGIDGAIAMSEGFVEGSISSTIVSLCASGKLGEGLKGASPTIVATLTFLVIEAAISGYDLAKGKITEEQFANMMIDRIMISLLMVPTSALAIAILPASKIAVVAGCMAGGLLVCTAYGAAKEAIMDITDKGGIIAIVPKEIADPLSSVRKTISELNIDNITSLFGEFTVTKLKDGLIRVKTA